MIVKNGDLPTIDKQCNAVVSWMDGVPLQVGSKYTVQHGVNKVIGKVEGINHKIHPDYSGVDDTVTALNLNDIGNVNFKLSKPIFFDSFKDHRTNGSFILIDNKSNNTVGVGFIQ